MSGLARMSRPSEHLIYDDVLADHAAYCRTSLKIRTKSGAVIPLELNGPQLHGHRLLEHQRETTGRVRAYWLKGRQQGASTYITSRHFRATTTDFGKRAAILTHEQQGTDNLFEMVQRYYKHLPPELKPHAGNASAKELYFDKLDSGYLVATAGTKGAGRSSTVQFFHGSEVAHWPNAKDHMAGLGQAIPNEPGTEIVLESTANGVGNSFHEGWQLAVAGGGDYIPIFTPWFWSPEYRRKPTEEFVLDAEEAMYAEAYGLDAEQMYWRRLKIRDDFQGDSAIFDQEYPASPEHAFLSASPDTLIAPVLVAKARNTKLERDPAAPKIWGLDVAEYGDDRSALAKRQGRVGYGIRYWSKTGPMALVGKVGIEWDNEPDPKPIALCVDVTGVGTGPADRLAELGIPVVRVHFGEKAFEEALYKDRRAEMATDLKKWFEDAPCSLAIDNLQDANALQQDCTTPKFHKDSSMRVVLESSEHIKKRGLKSPDGFWAMSLTHAHRWRAGGTKGFTRPPPDPNDWRTM